MTSSLTRFPGEVITDILTRLPPKSLLRFRCVSRWWCSEIDSPDFIQRHLTHSLNAHSNQALLLSDRDLQLVEALDSPILSATKLTQPLDPTDEGNFTRVLGSCNGLVALCDHRERVAIWNPYTRKHRILPASEIEFLDVGFRYRQFVVYGFGYDSVRDDYKLVRMIQFYGFNEAGFHSEVKVYSLKSNSWRRIRDLPYYLCCKRGYSLLANEAFHCLVRRRAGTEEELILAFDLRSEEYRILEQPDYGNNANFHMDVKVLGGQLCVVCNYDCNYDDYYVDVWVMKEYGAKESWNKLFRVSVNVRGFNEGFEFAWPLVYSKSGDKVLLHRGGLRFVWFDLKTNRIESLRVKNRAGRFNSWLLVGSLVAVGNEEKEN